MKAFEVSIRLRNNRLKQRRLDLGLTARQLAERAGVSYTSYVALEGLKLAPKRLNGTWSKLATKLAEFYFVESDELFPPVVCAVEKPVAIRRMDGPDIAELCMGKVPVGALPGEASEAAEQSNAVTDALQTLRPRHRDVLERRFGIGREEQTLEEISEDWGVGRERVRQIEAKALRLLRHPASSKKLKEHWGTP